MKYAYALPAYGNNVMMGQVPYTMQQNGKNDERIVGGFVFPFLLGGVTGAALAPAFWNNGYGYNRPPAYYPYQPYPYPYPYYRRWF